MFTIFSLFTQLQNSNYFYFLCIKIKFYLKYTCYKYPPYLHPLYKAVLSINLFYELTANETNTKMRDSVPPSIGNH